MNDPLAFNKVVAGFLCACLLMIGAGKFASFMQGADGHHDDHHSDENIHQKIPTQLKFLRVQSLKP